MADFVIDEWLWEDASGANGQEPQKQALTVITVLAASDHRLIFVEGSAFDRKAWNLCRSSNIVVVAIVREFLGRIRYNSDRCMVLKPEALSSIPNGLAASVEAKDHYLVQAQEFVAASILVTTDGPLHAEMKKAGRNCLSRDEFLRVHILS